MKPTIYFAADHWGFELIPQLRTFVEDELQHPTEHCGPYELDLDDDYPDFIGKAAKAVSNNPENSRAIIFGKSGQGEAMCANRYKHVRAAVYYGGQEEIVKLSREHNNANVLSLGAGFMDLDTMKHVIQMWLDEPFSEEERHIRRIKKLDTLHD